MEEYEAKVKANMLKGAEAEGGVLGFQLSPLPTQ